ncbi:hypothetical protein ES332_D05G262900v1 [Gossypium tomentosum]|uniref:Uncharacterized protein n=1 Tax=Gossypium tomentosum TaxID=34277 RepID=A0A5D2KZQ5_GOSTO|nr:hypothetical protein ES332_D05G262900v1 [Gossypium tomentosum]
MPKKGKKNGKGSAFSLLRRFQHRRKCPTASYEATQSCIDFSLQVSKVCNARGGGGGWHTAAVSEMAEACG